MSLELDVDINTKEIDALIKKFGVATDIKYMVHDGVHYGVFNEFGSKYITAKPDFVPALERHIKKLPEVLKQGLAKGVPLDEIIRITASNIAADWARGVRVSTKKTRRGKQGGGHYRNSITFTRVS